VTGRDVRRAPTGALLLAVVSALTFGVSATARSEIAAPTRSSLAPADELRELSIAATASTGPLGMSGERGLCMGVRIPVSRRLLLGGKARWHFSTQRADDTRTFDLHRTTALFEVVFRYQIGQRWQIMWIEGAGVGPVLATGGSGGSDWLAPALMPAGAVAWRMTEQWTVALGAGWLIQWIKQDGRRRRATTNQAELTLAYGF